MDDRNTPATKGDIESLETQMNGRFAAVDNRFAAVDEKLEMLRTEADHRYNDIKETLRDGQTEMLKAFYNYAESNNKRLAQNEVNEVANRARIETLERRVTELEQRLNIPPAA